jgi:hypothetical protein
MDTLFVTWTACSLAAVDRRWKTIYLLDSGLKTGGPNAGLPPWFVFNDNYVYSFSSAIPEHCQQKSARFLQYPGKYDPIFQQLMCY